MASKEVYVKSKEDLKKDLELLKTLPQGCYLELGLGSIDLKRFSTHRIKYMRYDNDGKWYYVIHPLLWRKNKEEPWYMSTVPVYAEEQLEELVNEMQRIHETKQTQEHVKYEFNVLRMFNVISEKLILEALPDFGWRVVITSEKTS